jgi:hypothetical protein
MRVPEAVKLAALVRTYEAKSGLPLANMAVPRAKVAMHLAARLRFPPPRFVEIRLFAENLQLLHIASPLNTIIRLFTRVRRYAAFA